MLRPGRGQLLHVGGIDFLFRVEFEASCVLVERAGAPGGALKVAIKGGRAPTPAQLVRSIELALAQGWVPGAGGRPWNL